MVNLRNFSLIILRFSSKSIREMDSLANVYLAFPDDCSLISRVYLAGVPVIITNLWDIKNLINCRNLLASQGNLFFSLNFTKEVDKKCCFCD